MKEEPSSEKQEEDEEEGMLKNQRQPLPEFTKFSIEQSMASLLEELMRDLRPLHVLECGSGVSTVLLGYLLEENGHGTLDTLEHDQKQYALTLQEVVKHGLSHIVQVHYAPIENHVVSYDNGVYPWYKTNGIKPERQFDFVFVDGPPGHLSTMARWPFLWVMQKRLAPKCVIVCDDASREQENVMINHWLEFDEHLEGGRVKTSRGAAILRRDHAKRRGTEAETPGPQEGSDGREGGRVRVWDAPQRGLEAAPGEARQG